MAREGPSPGRSGDGDFCGAACFLPPNPPGNIARNAASSSSATGTDALGGDEPWRARFEGARASSPSSKKADDREAAATRRCRSSNSCIPPPPPASMRAATLRIARSFAVSSSSESLMPAGGRGRGASRTQSEVSITRGNVRLCQQAITFV